MSHGKDLYIVHPDMPSCWGIQHLWYILDDSWEPCPHNLVGKYMLDGSLQLDSENLDHMEMEHMVLYLQQAEWFALEIERITLTCNMHYIMNNYKTFL
jgi:hypothetical protein